MVLPMLGVGSVALYPLSCACLPQQPKIGFVEFCCSTPEVLGLKCRKAVIAVVSGCDMNAPCPYPCAVSLIRDTNNLAGGANSESPPSTAGFCALHFACQVQCLCFKIKDLVASSVCMVGVSHIVLHV